MYLLLPFALSGHQLGRNFIHKQLKMTGFRVWKWSDRWTDGIEQNLDWMEEGKLKARETVIEGFDQAPMALINTLRGTYFGKVIVKV